MDNNSDDIILPETDVEIHAESPAPTRRKKTTLLIVVASIVFLALIIALVFVIIKSTDNKEETIPDTPSEETTFLYDDSAFNDTVNQAEDYIRTGDYLAARELLQQYALPERMTSTQRYRYYSTLAMLYADNAMNDQALHDRYADLAKRNLEAIQKGE